jgi:CBS domain-containing protein
MRCEEIMSQDVQWIRPDETVARTAKLMAFHNLGLLPVCNADGKAIGVITDRDIALRVVGEDRPAAKTKVGDVMTAPVQFVPPDCPVDRAGEMMVSARVSRLLVLDGEGHLKGVVSLADLLVHESAGHALDTARGIYARETPDHPTVGHPHPASEPTPEYFHGAHDRAPADESGAEHPARIEAENVNAGGDRSSKEFP